MVTSWERTGSALAVNPLLLVVDDFLSGNVMADEVDEAALGSGKDFLEGFEDKLIDEQVVHGSEVGSERHVINVVVRFLGSQGCVNELLVVSWVGGSPGFELLFQRLELSGCQVVSKSTGSAVG